MDLFDLFIKIGVDTNEVDKGLNNAQKSAKSFASSIGKGLKTAVAIGTTAIAVGTAAVAGITKSFLSSSKEIADYGDNIDKMSQKMGISATAYQEWEAVMKHSGTSMETLKAGMKTLANAVESGNKAFQRIGLTQEQIASMNQEELFDATIKGLQNVGNDTERTYLAGQLLGRGATELGALLNQSAEETQKMKDRVHELNGVMSDEAVKASAAYKDQLQDLQTAAGGLKRNLIGQLLPGVTDVMSGLTEIFSGNTEEGVEKLSEAVKSLVSKISEKVPQFLEVGGKIALAIGEGLISNFPAVVESLSQMFSKILDGVSENQDTIFSAVGSAIKTVADAILSNLPTVIQLGLNLIVSLAQGISSAAPEIIPAITECILTVVEALTNEDTITSILSAVLNIVLAIVNELTKPDVLNRLLGAALTLIKALGEGLLKALPDLISKLPEIINNIVSFLLGAVPQILGVAFQLLAELAAQLPNIIAELLSMLPTIISNLIDALVDDFIPQIIDFAFLAIETLIEKGPEIIFNLIKSIPKIVKSIISAFVKLIPQFVRLGANILIKLLDGITSMFGKIPETVGKIREKIFVDVKSIIDKALTWGKDLITNFVKGITDSINKVKGAVKGVASKIKSFLGFSEPEEGPLSNFHTFAPDMMKLFAQGIKDNEKLITDQIEKSFNFRDRILNMRVKAGYEDDYLDGGYGAGRGGVNVVQNIYSEAKTAADLMKEAVYQQEKAVLLGV